MSAANSPGPTLDRLTAGGLRWHVRPDCRDLLVGPRGLRLDEWRRAGLAQVVKHGPHRTVYRVELPGCDFYLKHFRLPDRRAWLRACLRPSKARVEFDRAVAVAARHVPTLEPLALGEPEGLRPGDSFLATRTLPRAVPLGIFLETDLRAWPGGRQACLRQRLAASLGRFLARMHAGGIRHDDLHPGNLLLQLGEGDDPALFLIDLHAVAVGPPLGPRDARANLVMLNRWFILRSGRSDRLRFWTAYDEERSAGQGGGAREEARRHEARRHEARRQEARELEARTWADNLAFWTSRDRRCREPNRYYRPVGAREIGGSTRTAGWALAGLDADCLGRLLRDPDEPFRQPGAVLLKDSRTSTVAEFAWPGPDGPRPVIYKRFHLKKGTSPWVSLVRLSPALRSWVFGQGLRERCLPTPRPLLVLHRRRAGLPREGYLLTEQVPDARELGRHVEGLAARPEDERRPALRALTARVARLVREMHRRGLCHRDLKAANILVASSRLESPFALPFPMLDHDGPGPWLWLIDLVGVTRRARVSRARAVQNLARLHASFLAGGLVTRTDKLRFLRDYLQWGVMGREGWKPWWREVAQATRDKVDHNRRTGRPLA